MAKRTAAYSGNNKVKLIKGGRPYFDQMQKMICEARESVFLQVYIFDVDGTGKKIARALLNAAKNGVKVYVLLDGYASQQFPEKWIERFSVAGIHFRWFEPLLKSKNYYFGRRLHHKVLVVDSEHALVAGINVSDRYNDTSQQPAWLDWALYVKGDVVPAIESTCAKWAKVRRHRKNNGVKIKISTGHSAVRVRVNDWVNRELQITNSYREMFRDATSHIIIMSSYFMPGNSFRKQLSKAANRGVKVQVVLAGTSDIGLAKYAERFVYPWLLRHKIEIYEYQKNILHGKIATYDGQWVTAGSYNFNNISAFASIELNLDVKDEGLAKHVESELTKIIRMDCVQITQDVYKQSTSLFQLFLQRSAYDIIRVLLFLFTFYFKQRE
jgi:cardiolipin synthase